MANKTAAPYKICALPGYYTVSNGNPLPTFQDNVGKVLLFNAA